jgi:hypothetical protein
MNAPGNRPETDTQPDTQPPGFDLPSTQSETGRPSKSSKETAGFDPIDSQLYVRASYCNFLNRLSMQRIEEDYAGLF